MLGIRMTNYTDRQGKLYLPYDLVMGKGSLAAPPFASILAKLAFVPLRVELLAYSDTFEYIGYSPMFSALADGHQIPTYVVVVMLPSDYPLREFELSIRVSVDDETPRPTPERYQCNTE